MKRPIPEDKVEALDITKRLKKHHEQAGEKPKRRPSIVAGDWQPGQKTLVRYSSEPSDA